MKIAETIGEGVSGVLLKVVRVSRGKQIRVRFPAAEAEAAVSWLRGKSVECRLLRGVYGGGTLVPTQELDPRDRMALAGLVATMDDADDPELARQYLAYLATSCVVTVLHEKGGDRKPRYSLTIPLDARRLGWLPGGGEYAVVFGVGSSLEIWRGNDWLAHSAVVLGRIDEARDYFEAEPEYPHDDGS